MKHQATDISHGSAWVVLLTASVALVLALLAVFLEPVRETVGDSVQSLLLLTLTMIVYGNTKRLRALEKKR